MDEIEILEIKDLLSQQMRDVHAELEAIKLRLPKPPPRWWEIATDIIATMLVVGLSFIGALLLHRYLFYNPYLCL